MFLQIPWYESSLNGQASAMQNDGHCGQSWLADTRELVVIQARAVFLFKALLLSLPSCITVTPLFAASSGTGGTEMRETGGGKIGRREEDERKGEEEENRAEKMRRRDRKMNTKRREHDG